MISPTTRRALEAIQDASNQDEAALLASVHGLILRHAGELAVSVMHERGGWVIQLMPHHVRYLVQDHDYTGEFPTAPYSAIKDLLRDDV